MSGQGDRRIARWAIAFPIGLATVTAAGLAAVSRAEAAALWAQAADLALYVTLRGSGERASLPLTRGA